jgi:tRNA (guanine-N(7)-)-methyltransferase subunit TRM82
MEIRVMPKRPCAVTITDDDSTIITADKFGDVYSLPLLVPMGGDQLLPELPVQSPESGTGKPFVPAANDLTVHSQRNRKALENQKRQTNKPSEKSEPNFEHKLLLGHVSMLTDITLVTLQERRYIITADRDEHIRISRGIPQAHIIDGFCLGHTEFVSQLCVPTGKSNLLISAGGDDDIFVWKWLSRELVSKANLKSHVETAINSLNSNIKSSGSSEQIKVAVSGLSHIKLHGEDGTEDVVTVTCEG